MVEELYPTSTAVHLENVCFSYDKQPILQNVNLDVNEGEFVVIVGKSGSGKTTLLKAITRLITASGKIDVQGEVRMVFQEGRLFPWYKVHQNIGMALTNVNSFLPANKKKRKAYVNKLLEELNMLHLRNRFPHELSGGEKQRIAIARAFAPKPKIILMDEPFGSLDVLTREKMQTWLLEFWQKNRIAVIFVTHDVEEGLLLADRITVLINGQLLPVNVVDFPRPRLQSLRYSAKFLEARQDIRKKLMGENL